MSLRMKTYQYEVVDSKGKNHKGSMEAESANKVADALTESQYKILSIDEKVSVLNIANISAINIGGIPLKEKVIFMRQLATMLSAGISLLSSLEILAQQITNAGFKVAVGNIEKKVAEGMSFAKAIQTQEGVFDEITIALVKAGEESGKMEEIFLDLASELEKKEEFQGKIKSAMIYPIVMFFMIIVVVTIVMVFMVPTLTEMFAEFGDKELPFATRIVIAISDFMINQKFVILAFILGAGIGGKYYYDSANGRKNIDKILIKLPVMGKLIINMQVASFTRTMSLLFRSGMDIVDILNLTRSVLSNYWFRKTIDEVAIEIKKGVPMALPLSRSEYMPPIVSRMIAVGEETGKLDVIFDKLTEYYNREVSQMADNLSSLLEPVMLVIMGIVVAFIAFAVYGPLFSMSQMIGS